MRLGAPLDAPAEGGGTALHWAAAQGQERVVLALCAGGADPDARDAFGNTPLDLAEGEGFSIVRGILVATKRR